MRPGQQKQRSRGRGNNGGSGSNGSHNNNNNNMNRKGQNPLTRTYDSSGPDVKIRGTAQTIAEKYMALARDASSSGDRVMAENYLQHAEHYNRIIAAAQAMYQERYQQSDRQDYGDRDEDDADGQAGDSLAADMGQPEQPQMQPRERDQQRQPDRPPQSERPPQHERLPRPPRDSQPPREPRQPREVQAADPLPQPVVVAEQPRMVIDESTPQPVIEGTPAEVQIEAEVSTQENAAPARRRSAGRPRRTPRTAADKSEAAAETPAPEPAEVPAE